MSGRDSQIISKLKEGIQDAIVYLRMLEGAKLAPIYERKRKQVMQRLLELQGEGRKDLDVPSMSSVDDQSVEEELASISTEESPARKRHSLISSGEDDEGARIVRRNSKLLGLMSKFEQPDDSKSSFKYKTLEQLKNKQSDQPEEDEEEEEASPVPEEPAVEELAEEDDEQPAAATEEVVEEKSRTKARFGKFKKLFKSSKDKDKPYAPVEVEASSETQETAEQAGQKEGEEEETKEVDSDIRLSSQLDRVTKRLGTTQHQRVYVTLRSTTLTVAKSIKGEDSREIALAGTSVSTKDSVHFEFHCDKKGLVFRTDCEETCQQWFVAMQTAITECSPEQPAATDKTSPQTSVDGNETVPQITVSVEPAEGDNAPGSPAITSSIRESVSTENLSKKKDKKKKATGLEMPSLAVITMKGYLYQKGTFSWDKKWCVFTADNTLYIATSETSQRPNTVLVITTDSKVQRKNGPDKCRHAVSLAAGGKKEQLGTDSETDFTSWIDLLEQAAGCAQIQELLSEDEDGEFYEDLAGSADPAPVVPASPRPAHSFEPSAVPEEDDFDDDIYEAPDEVDIPKRPALSVPAPSLPPRNDPKTPSPSLPPRGAPSPRGPPAPSLPPRHPVGKTKAPAPAPPIDDEVYDDVVTQTEEMEETYDDVLTGGDGPEETYDDVMVQGGGVMEELYEELETDLPLPKPAAPVPAPVVEAEQEEYTEMELPGRTEVAVEDDDEFYVDVEQAPPARPLRTPSTSITTPAKSIPASTTAARRGTSPSTPTKFTSSYTPTKQASSPSTPSKLSSSFTPAKPSPPPSARTSSPVAQRAATASASRAVTKPGGAGSKVASLSRMFGAPAEQSSRPGPPKPSLTSSSQSGSTHSGSLMYKSPSKKGYASEWCILNGYSLSFHSSQTDIVSHYKVSIRDMTLQLGVCEGRSNPFAFYLMRGATIHQFQANKKEDLVGWIATLVGVVKEVAPSEGSVYVATTDRDSKTAGQLSYKRKAMIWVVHRDSSGTWTGLLGKTPTSFTSTHGQFPAGDVQQYDEENTYF